MHSLPASFALWRIQADTVANLLFAKRMKRQAKQLKNVLRSLDRVWMHEYGDLYVDELLRLIELHQKSADLLADIDKSSEVGATETAANDDEFGLLVFPFPTGEAP